MKYSKILRNARPTTSSVPIGKLGKNSRIIITNPGMPTHQEMKVAEGLISEVVSRMPVITAISLNPCLVAATAEEGMKRHLLQQQSASRKYNTYNAI